MTAQTRQATRRRGALIPLGHWFGIEVGADGTWLIVFLLITLSLSSHLAGQHPTWSPAELWSLGLLTSALFFVSIILHELGHSLVAIRRGVPVRSITLFVFGGVALLEGEPRRPKDELAIAVAGPAVSFALGGAFWALSSALGPEAVLGGAARWLGHINLVLATFNLIPGFPLDGGRVLRAVLWGTTGSLSRATAVAAGIGSLIAYGFMGVGVFLALARGDLLGGIWVGFVGWFLLSAARSSLVQNVAGDELQKIPVAEVMDTDCAVHSPAAPLQHIVDEGVLRRGQRCFLIAREGHLLGMLTLHEIRKVPREEWPTTSAQAVMLRVEDLHAVAPGDSLFAAMRAMDQAGVNQLPVVDGGRLVGSLNRERLLAVLRNRLELRP
jgi:Zn-dependent protease/predicted transcriptional regulator